MTKTTTNATTNATKEVKNIKFKVSQSKKELVITVPLADFEMSKMVQSDLSENELTKNGNYLVASSRGWESIKLEGFEHIGFSLSATAKKKAVDETKRALETKKVATEVQSESKQAAMPEMDPEMAEAFKVFLTMYKAMGKAK